MTERNFPYEPLEHEAEKASNSYLMSVVSLVVGLPLPIMNLLATLIFFFGYRRSTYFVRWHCMQALLSQFSLLFINSIAFWWTVSILFDKETITNEYITYMVAVVVLNLIEFIATLYAAVQVRKGKHVYWWLYGPMADSLVKP
jgi:uncharacterized membrane protein